MNESTYNLIINKTDIKIQESFLEDLSIKTISICPLLKKFPIFVVSCCDTNYAKKVGLSEKDVFSYYMNKEREDASSTYAEIIVNERLCETLKFTELEFVAAIAHEIGHIITFFRADKDMLNEQDLEYSSDAYACRMGLASPLSSLLYKLVQSDLYSEIQVQQMKRRMNTIAYMNYDNH